MKREHNNLHRAIMAYVQHYKNNITIVNDEPTKAFQKRIDRVVKTAKEMKVR